MTDYSLAFCFLDGKIQKYVAWFPSEINTKTTQIIHTLHDLFINIKSFIGFLLTLLFAPHPTMVLGTSSK